MMSHNIIRAKLYIDLLQSLALEDTSLQNAILDITLASILTDSVNIDSAKVVSCSPDHIRPDSLRQQDGFYEKELLMYGTPARHLLNPSTRQRLLEKVQTTLRSITELFRGDLGISEYRHPGEELENQLPGAFEHYKDEIQSLRQEIRTISLRLMELTVKIIENQEGLDLELKQARVATFPPHDAARSASVDLLAATIETSLIKLSLTRARSERALYHHQANQKGERESKDVAQAISALYTALKKDEMDMKIESNSLDQQLQEYETMLQLVDGGSGGYQQIVNDWTKVRRETDECLKDLRRLGWTGD